jgi:hypothetical protein
LSLGSFKIFFINFLCLNFHLEQKNWYHSLLNNDYRHGHDLQKWRNSYLLLHGFYLGTESLAPFAGPSCRELRSQWSLGRERVLGTTIRFKYESWEILTQNCRLLQRERNN